MFFRLCRNIVFRINTAGFKENYFLSGLKASLYCLLPKSSRWNGDSLYSTIPVNVKRVIGMWPCVNERLSVMCCQTVFLHLEQRSSSFLDLIFFQSLPLSRAWTLHSTAPSKKEWPTSASRSRALRKVSVLVIPCNDRSIFFCWPLQITSCCKTVQSTLYFPCMLYMEKFKLTAI